MDGKRNPTSSEVAILIVEDSPTQAAQLEYILEQHGYQVSVSKNGKEALTSISGHKPTIVISDISMPEMDGYQLCQRIKTDENLKDIPVILLTSLSDSKDIMRGLDCGADNFITKPYDEDYLLARVEYFLSNWELRKSTRVQMGVEIFFAGQRHFINPDRLQILDLLLATYETAVQKNQQLIKTQDESRALNEQLEEKVAERTTALIAENAERKRAEEEIKKLNAELERRVIERTSELAAANKELEAFSYSVSHDLRAPLRSIDGFSQALLEDYTNKLDEQGQDYLRRVRAASQRMGQLIDDLLALARVTRSEMRREEVDLSALAQVVAAELQHSQPERQVEFVIAPGVVVNGDAGLLRVVLENLLGNAWKFTGKKAQARIEFGVSEHNGKPTYFIRDNGAGFNLAYADRLFGAFQRLHSGKEFSGTGVGLATVQRIIHRHGGKVWAQGAVEQGATFHFTL
jgi:signal transduction histidine kinase